MYGFMIEEQCIIKEGFVVPRLYGKMRKRVVMIELRHVFKGPRESRINYILLLNDGGIQIDA